MLESFSRQHVVIRQGTDVCAGGVFDNSFGMPGDLPIPPRRIDPIELNRLQWFDEAADLLCRQGDQVGVAVHETDRFPIHRNHQRIAHKQRALSAGAVLPGQN